jgi:hypothetical protein
MVGLLSYKISVVNFFFIWCISCEVCYGHVRYMFVACIAFVWNVYQLCLLKLKKKTNVNLGCLKCGVCVPNDVYSFAVKIIHCLSALMVEGIGYDTKHT